MSQRTKKILTDCLTDAGRADSIQAPSFALARSLKRELLEELRAHREEGDPVAPEELLPRWPGDPNDDPDVASLLFEDFQQRQRAGDEPSIVDYEKRFPEHKDSLAGLFRDHAVLRSVGASGVSAGAKLALPAVGDELFRFHLNQELGRGAFARVFLAQQADLAGRPVVLKVSGIDGNEPQTLAQLQHTHIVPIYSVHEDDKSGLRAVCMPYFGGASLSRVLQKIWEDTERPTQGAELVRALEQVASPSSAEGQPPVVGDTAQDRGALPLLEKLSYIQAAAWVVARLAEGLQHAHDRGVLHRDIKPSNILLGTDGQPMLLDFNLAQSVHGDQAQAAATLGGTVSYMAPEHLRALATRNHALARQVDQRADIYSLGMVLYEMLAGHSPFAQSASYSPLPALIEAMAVERSKTAPSLRRRRSDAPWSLESIVSKCLAPDAARRYQRPEELAEDLRRFLTDQPLKHAPELSRKERLRKWLRRHPRVTSSGSVASAAAVLLIAVGAALAGVREHLASTSAELEKAQARKRKQDYQAGTERALCLVNTTSDSHGLAGSARLVEDHLPQGLAVCEETLALYDVLEREDWQEHPHWRLLDENDRRQLAEDTRELLLLLAWARVRTHVGDQAVLRQALTLLDRAEAIRELAPSPALGWDRVSYLEQLGETKQAEAARAVAEQTPPSSARDHYLLATTHVRQHRHAEAMAELNHALRLNPRHYWSWVQRGICHHEQGEYALAAGDFGVCIGLWPEFAWGYFNRGCALYKSGKKAEAIEDYTAALERDPGFLLAYWNRGLALREREEYEPALADLNKAGELGRDDAFLHAERGLALERLGRVAAAEEAFQTAFHRAVHEAPEARASIRWWYGFAVAQRLPQKARESFEAVLKDNPRHPQALYGLAMLAVEQGQPDEAMTNFNRAIDAQPSFVDARRYRAILLARGGNLEAASQDINWCLEREPSAGPTLYAAACVYALAVARLPRPLTAKMATDAIALLREAFARGHGRSKAADDPDLAALRDRDDFQQLLKKTQRGGDRATH